MLDAQDNKLKKKNSTKVHGLTIHWEVPKLLLQQEICGLVAKALDCQAL